MADREPVAILVDFVQKWIADRYEGRIHESSHYEAMYPGFEDSVHREYLRLAETPSIEDTGPTASTSSPGASDPDPWIGPYQIVRLVGAGGQGTVYEAIDARLHRRAAVKLLNGLGSSQSLKRFHREAAVLASFDHPGICTLYEAGSHRGQPYLAMRFVEGRSLSQLVGDHSSEGPGPVLLPGLAPATSPAERSAAIVRLFADVARAIEFAHERGVIHRDIKPANIVIGEDGRPVVLDFGLARATESEANSMSATGDVLGTPAFLAPEHVAGSKSDLRVDVYALGVSLYECLTKRRPFEAATREALLRRILADPPVDPRPWNPAIGRDLLAVIETALAKDPDKRYRSAKTLADDLAAAAAGAPVSVRRAGAAARAWQWARRHRAAAGLLATALVVVPVIAGLGGYLAAKMPDLAFAETRRQEEADERKLLAGYDLLFEGRDSESIAAFDSLTASPSVGLEALAGLALAHLRTPSPENALDVLDRVSPAHATSPAFASLRIRALTKLGRPVPGDVSKQAAQPARDAFDFYLLGTDAMDQAVLAREDPAAYERAYRLLTRAVIDPHMRPRYHFARARVFGYIGPAHPDEAREAAQILQTNWPDSPVAWHWSGFALNQVDPVAAQRAYAKARELTRGGAPLFEVVRSNRPASQGSSRPATRTSSRPTTRRRR